MSERDPLEELMEFGLSNVNGPTTIAPPQPEPYNTCRGCRHFNKSMMHSGGLRGAPSYSTACSHPEVEGVPGRDYRSLDTGFRGASSGSRNVTPSWCPVLIAKEQQDDT